VAAPNEITIARAPSTDVTFALGERPFYIYFVISCGQRRKEADCTLEKASFDIFRCKPLMSLNKAAVFIAAAALQPFSTIFSTHATFINDIEKMKIQPAASF